MIKQILLITLLFLGVTGSAMAQSLYVGSGVAIQPSEPDFTQDSLTAPMVGYDFPQLWRVSLQSMTSKDTKSTPDTKITESVVGVQRLFIYPMNDALSLIGALGAGWYLVNVDGAKSISGNGAGFGLMADGGARWNFSKNLFVDASFQYRDSGIQIGATGRDYTVDGGWTGVAAAVGWRF